jgi:hypothetical protein
MARLSVAQASYLGRWSLEALRRVDAELHDRVVEQRDLAAEAFVTGEDEEFLQHGEAMCRGWLAAVECMEAAVRRMRTCSGSTAARCGGDRAERDGRLSGMYDARVIG